MTSDRHILNELNAKKREIINQINSITFHSSGKTYGKMLSNLIYEYVDYKTQGQNLQTWERYNIYNKIHYYISSKLCVKTQVFTKEEYIQALEIFKATYNYNIDEKYYC